MNFMYAKKKKKNAVFLRNTMSLKTVTPIFIQGSWIVFQSTKSFLCT